MRNRIIVAVLLGQLVGLLGWIDAAFIPLVLAGPLITGVVTASRRWPLVLVVVLWVSGGLNMAWTDYVVSQEDVAFHLVLSVVIAVLATAGFGAVRLVQRVRRDDGRCLTGPGGFVSRSAFGVGGP